jgi:ribosomal protein L40E
MEMLIIGLIALASFAAVLVPLMRRRSGVGDEHEFAGDPPANTAPRAEPASGDASVSAALEAEILRYRAAVRAGSVCRKCGQANPAGSAYCYECGSRLPLADAKEYE